MAGSLRWFRYTDDSATPYSVLLDESNSRATCGGVALCLARTAAHPREQKSLSKRYVNCSLASNPNIKRRFWVGNSLAIPQILAGAAFLAVVYPTADDASGTAVAWTINSYRG
jgi:hypothetical protein